MTSWGEVKHGSLWMRKLDGFPVGSGDGIFSGFIVIGTNPPVGGRLPILER